MVDMMIMTMKQVGGGATDGTMEEHVGEPP